jgi:tripartite-type tricarboxylate transporter receptor subunit TctC
MKKLKGLLTGILLVSMLTACGGGGSETTQSNESAKPQDNKQASAEPQKSDYPTKAITIYLPYSAGGTSDVLTRTLEPFLAEKLGQTVIVENKAGGSGSIAMNAVMAAKPDGYTLGITSNGPSVLTPMLNDVGYTYQDYIAINQITSLPYVFTVRSDSPYKSVDEFFAYAKANPNKLKIGIPGATTSQAIILGQLASENGVEFNLVPFDGGAKTLNALLGGNVDATLNLVTEVVSQIEGGKLKGLAITEKSGFLPDISTFKDQGINTEVIGAYYGLMAHKDTPQPIIDKLDQAMKEVLQDPKVKEGLVKIYLDPVYSDQKGFRTLIDQYNADAKKILNK